MRYELSIDGMKSKGAAKSVDRIAQFRSPPPKMKRWLIIISDQALGIASVRCCRQRIQKAKEIYFAVAGLQFRGHLVLLGKLRRLHCSASYQEARRISRLERWRFPPVLAVLSVVGIAFVIIGGLCATVSVEALDLANSLPKYTDNIHAKWAAIQQGPPGPLNLAFRNVGSLIDDLSKVTAPAKPGQETEPMKVQVVNGTEAAVAFIRNTMSPVLSPIVDLVVVVVLVIFILLERRRLRDRFLRLIGHSRFATTTLAIDGAGTRLSGFLLGQLEVNGVYALILWIGLSLIGIPNAILWAILTLLLRFLPYVGLWISAFFPLVLSVAISSDWTTPLFTFALYGFLEVFTNNVVEPIVLGGSTGISPLAVIISALFWTWLWDRLTCSHAASRLSRGSRPVFFGVSFLQRFISGRPSYLFRDKIFAFTYRKATCRSHEAHSRGRYTTFR